MLPRLLEPKTYSVLFRSIACKGGGRFSLDALRAPSAQKK